MNSVAFDKQMCIYSFKKYLPERLVCAVCLSVCKPLINDGKRRYGCVNVGISDANSLDLRIRKKIDSTNWIGRLTD